MLLLRTLFLTILMAAASGCGLIYRVTVPQGNLLDPDRVKEVEIGMTKRQVTLLLGTPSIVSPFDQDRWDYTTSVSRRGRAAKVKSLSMQFENDALVKMEGDFLSDQDQELLRETARLRKAGATLDEETPDTGKKRR